MICHRRTRGAASSIARVPTEPPESITASAAPNWLSEDTAGSKTTRSCFCPTAWITCLGSMCDSVRYTTRRRGMGGCARAQRPLYWAASAYGVPVRIAHNGNSSMPYPYLMDVRIARETGHDGLLVVGAKLSR